MNQNRTELDQPTEHDVLHPSASNEKLDELSTDQLCEIAGGATMVEY
jgi:hypothetical protein